MTLAHLARCAALILANPAAEMRRLGAIETTLWPRARAQRAFCEAEILARAAALIFRGPRTAPVVFNPLSALIAVSNAFTCCAALSRSAFNCAIMSMCSSPGEDCNRRSVTQESLLESAPAYNSPRVVKCYGESAQVAKDGARQNSK